jgi:hypothetical protein
MFTSGRPPILLCSVEQLDWRKWIDRRNGVLVNELGLSTARKQNAKAVEEDYRALELDPVFEEHGHRNLTVLKVPEEHILNRLDPLYCHVEFLSLILVIAETAGASL